MKAHALATLILATLPATTAWGAGAREQANGRKFAYHIPRFTHAVLARALGRHGFVPHAWTPDAKTIPRRIEDLRTSALALLVYLGESSTLRTGYHRKRVRKLFLWTRARLLTHGPKPRARIRGARLSLRDRAIACFALCEAARLSDLPSVMPRLEAPIAALFRQLQALPELAPLDSEAMLWSHLCARSLARYEDFMRRTGRSEEVDPSPARRLRRRLDKLLESKRARSRTTPRMRAALALLRLVRDDQDQGARSTIDKLLCEDIRDTWAVFYSCAAAFRLSSDPDWRDRWSAFRRRLGREVVATQSKTAGAWTLRESDGMKSVSEKTALNSIVLQIYYRYCDLHFTS